MKCKPITLTLFITVFSISSIFSQQWNPRHPGWTDSFAARGFCWCNSSNFDHGIGTKTVAINGTPYKIVDICDELKKHPLYRVFQNGDAPYNDIQCGNGPANDAPDETGCPGRTDLGPSGCNQIGPKWDMNWLKGRPRFGGDTGGGNNNGPDISFNNPLNNASYQAPATITVDVKATDNDGVSNVRLYINNSFIRQENISPYEWNQNSQDEKLKNLGIGTYTLKAQATDKKGNITTKTINIIVDDNGGGNNGGSVTIKGQSINKYISSEGGSRSMRANRNTAGTGEQFTIQSAGNGTVSLKGNNGKYVSSENGNKAMNCNRNAVGSWEKFRLEPLGGDLYAIKGNNNKYVSHENGRDMGIFCNRNAIGSWEKFAIKGLNVSDLNLQNVTSSTAQSVSVYPNPVIKGNNVRVQVTTPQDVLSSIEIMDLNGKSIIQRSLGVLRAGTISIPLDSLRSSVKTNGLYLVKITLGKKTIVKQVMIE
ncbi:Ig-like domain-containing protein [Aquimarina mytili]|uniref:T9SS type A sorting domain-containing protein n=1 Tax=Aquimarina mytili TaxID=874423 RepID=A0A937DB79_9FLAO|nr:Ig-like domain-containing protein [Aquimarina mytili]MBL0685467.1 T9SS type A sorting domain-containing protein [Aquimarina mytili]